MKLSAKITLLQRETISKWEWYWQWLSIALCLHTNDLSKF